MHEVEVLNFPFDGHDNRDHYGYYYCRTSFGWCSRERLQQKGVIHLIFDIILLRYTTPPLPLTTKG